MKGRVGACDGVRRRMFEVCAQYPVPDNGGRRGFLIQLTRAGVVAARICNILGAVTMKGATGRFAEGSHVFGQEIDGRVGAWSGWARGFGLMVSPQTRWAVRCAGGANPGWTFCYFLPVAAPVGVA